LYEEADYTATVSQGKVIEKGGFELRRVKKELPRRGARNGKNAIT